ncbi:MAG: competence/damage-inducible protein A [Bacillota bacterium]
MRCEIIAVGTELLMGQIVNTNGAEMARDLAGLGIGVYYQTVVGDNEERLAEVFSLALKRADLIICSGGLGPTTDDITRETVARVLGLPLEQNEFWVKKLYEYFERVGRPLIQSNLRQAMLPRGGRLLPNDRGTAPGIFLEHEQRIFVLLPGPPGELLPMFRRQVIPLLRERLEQVEDLAVLQSKVLRVSGLGESLIAERIKDVLDKQDNPTIAPLARGGREVHLRLTARAGTAAEAARLLEDKAEEIRRILGDYIYGEDEEGLEHSVARLLWQKKMTIAVAESCSGGLLSHRLTDVPGSSLYMMAGLITYSNAAKADILGVDPQLIARRGAVSNGVALQMACGARRVGRAHIGIGITGIAGPDGGTAEKPVGLTYIALVDGGFDYCRDFHFWGSRQEIKERAAQTALHLLRLYLLGKL